MMTIAHWPAWSYNNDNHIQAALHSLHDANKETTKMAFLLMFVILCCYCIYSVFVNEKWHEWRVPWTFRFTRNLSCIFSVHLIITHRMAVYSNHSQLNLYPCRTFCDTYPEQLWRGGILIVISSFILFYLLEIQLQSNSYIIRIYKVKQEKEPFLNRVCWIL